MRDKVSGARRWVVKIGSALLTADGRGLDQAAMAVWVDQMVALRAAGVELVLVSSGAVAAGMSRLGWASRPKAVHELQAAAAVGQMGLIRAWESSFARCDQQTAQILVTHDDLSDRKRYLNARSTLRTLIDLGVVPVINVAGVAPGALKLDGPTLANIFLGKIKTWNDPAIAALNSGLTLPNAKITIVHRSDGSGTTFNFVNYLSKVSPEWKSKVGEGTSVQWPAGIGGKGNEGVAAYVKQIKGSIGYVELAYALQNAMPYTALQNAAGTWVQPNAETFAAAAASADWASAKDFNLVITNAPGEQAWPITATNFMLMQKKPKDAKRNQDTLAFFKWAFENGQTQANELHYVPLPAELTKQIEAYWGTELK